MELRSWSVNNKRFSWLNHTSNPHHYRSSDEGLFLYIYILYFSCTNSISTTILPISAHANQNCFGVLKSKRIALCFVLWFFILLCPSLSFLPSLVLGSSKEKTTIRTTSLWKIVHTRYNIPSQPMFTQLLSRLSALLASIFSPLALKFFLVPNLYGLCLVFCSVNP